MSAPPDRRIKNLEQWMCFQKLVSGTCWPSLRLVEYAAQNWKVMAADVFAIYEKLETGGQGRREVDWEGRDDERTWVDEGGGGKDTENGEGPHERRGDDG